MPKPAPPVDHEQRFRSLFENNLDLLLYQNREGVILDANKPFLALLHLLKAGVVGHHINDFLPPGLIPLFHEKLHEAIAGQQATFEVAMQFRGAVPKVLSISKVPLLGQGAVLGVHVVCRDITEFTASHQLIAQQAHQLNTLFESITDALLLLDRHWHITFLNHEVERQRQLHRAEVLGKTWGEVFPEEVGGVFEQHYQQALRTGQAVHFEAYYAKRRLWLEVKAFPSEEGLSVYFSDITPRKEAEASQEKLTQDLYQHNQDLQEFSYLVSHNLRAPLANALDLVELLYPTEEAQAEALTYLRQSLSQLDVLLQELTIILTVRDKRDGPADALVPVPLAQVLAQVVGRLPLPLQQAGGTVSLEVPDELVVQGTYTSLFNIFQSLLVNTVTYRSPERPLRVTIAGRALPEGGMQVTVADNGSGFDREKAGADVFKLYKRFHAAPAGRGLGLYFVQAYVSALGGRITVQSQPGAGTAFTLYFL
jgi:PAS domain S-box-containing protein